MNIKEYKEFQDRAYEIADVKFCIWNENNDMYWEFINVGKKHITVGGGDFGLGTTLDTIEFPSEYIHMTDDEIMVIEKAKFHEVKRQELEDRKLSDARNKETRRAQYMVLKEEFENDENSNA